jgi:hypothetical protein
MSKFFIDEIDKFRVNFPDGEWIDIKTELSQSDSDYIMNAMIQAEALDGKNEPKLNIKVGKLPLLERSIIDWSFKDGDKIIPVNNINIGKLKSKYRTKVLQEIDRLNNEAGSFLAT